MHLFWCVVMIPVVWAFTHFGPHRLRAVGVVLAATAAIAAAALVGWNIVGWLRWASDADRPQWPKRAAYALLTTSDVPLIQTFLAGLVCVALDRAKIARADLPDDGSSNASDRA